MSGKLNLALAVLAYQKGDKDECLSYMAKAGEFGDDLTQFVTEIMKPAPTAARNDGTTPQAENTIAPSLAATASDFVSLCNRVSRQMACASHLDDGDELEYDFADDVLEDDEFDLDNEPEGLDEDEEESEEDDSEFEAEASALPTPRGPIRYKS